MMKKLFAAISVGAVLIVSACASDGAYVSGGAGYYTGYYDNYYGPVRYGYWGPDNYFYYSTVVTGPYIRDDSRHFRRERWERARHFRMHGQPDHH